MLDVFSNMGICPFIISILLALFSFYLIVVLSSFNTFLNLDLTQFSPVLNQNNEPQLSLLGCLEANSGLVILGSFQQPTMLGSRCECLAALM